MVEKPTEGVCSGCGAEALEFYDDGSGRCMNCGRTFRWASEEELKKDKSKKKSSRSRSSQQPRQRSSSRSEPSRKKSPKKELSKRKSSRSKQSQSSGQRPSSGESSRQARSSRSQPRRTSEPSRSESRRTESRRSSRRSTGSRTRKKESKAFLWIAVTGFIVMMVGYGMVFGLNAADVMVDDGVDDIAAYHNIAFMLNYIGILIIGVGLVWGAATAEQLDDKVRSRMLMAMAILLGLFLSLNFFIMSMSGVLG